MITNLILTLLTIFQYALFIRVILDYVRIFARNWRPNTFLLSFFELIYGITDPPMRFVQRFIPPLRLGGVAIDLSFIVLLLAIAFAKGFVVIIL